MQPQWKWSRRASRYLASGLLCLLLLAACQPAAAPTEVPAATVAATEAPAEATEAPAATEVPTEEAAATEEPTEEVAATAVPAEEAAAAGATQFAYVGTYTRGAPGGWSEAAEATHPTGVTVFGYNPEDGALTLIETVPSDNPSFVAIHPSQQYLYVSNEIADYEGVEGAGSLEAYAIDGTTGKLTLINRQAVGSIPAQIAVDPTGGYVVVGNYVGATFEVLAINDDGSLEPVSDTVTHTGSGPHERQEAPHPHAVVFDPSGAYIATADLGIDQIVIFQLQAGKLVSISEVTVAAGSGPRHLAFHPSGNYLYAINELTGSVIAFAFDPATGQLGAEIQTIGTVPDDFPEHKSTAEIMVHPSGKFLYGSNRKFEDHPLADSIVAYSIDEATGELTLIGHTTENIQFPRAFSFDPTGTWLYALNQKGDTIVQFAIDQTTGELSATGLVTEVPVPVSIAFKTE